MIQPCETAIVSSHVPCSASPWIRPILIGGNFGTPFVLIGTHFRFPWLIALGVCFHACFLYAMIAPACNWFGPVVTRFQPRGREVWLTIDDGPSGEDSVRLGEEMAQRGVRATFFVKGDNLAREPAVGRALLAAGHTLANHTQTHPTWKFWWLRPVTLRMEIDASNAVLRRIGVEPVRWFRSPVGLKHVFLQPALARRGMRLIAWSVRARDGIECQTETVVRRIAAGVSPGAIILLHEGRSRSREAILRVVDDLHARGYSFVIPEDGQLI